MGWTSTHRERGMTDRAFFEREFPVTLTERGEIVACATVRGVFYAAVRNKTDGRTWALIVLLKRTRGWCNFTYKEMDETAGPGDHGTPASVLDALSPTTDKAALAWRARCRENLAARAARPRVTAGDVVTFQEPVTFQNGDALATLVFVKGARFRSPQTGLTYHITNWRRRAYTVAAAGGSVSDP